MTERVQCVCCGWRTNRSYDRDRKDVRNPERYAPYGNCNKCDDPPKMMVASFLRRRPPPLRSLWRT